MLCGIPGEGGGGIGGGGGGLGESGGLLWSYHQVFSPVQDGRFCGLASQVAYIYTSTKYV